MIKIKVADIIVGIENRHRHIEWLCREYLSDGEPEFTVRAEDRDIERERAMSEAEFSEGYLESVVIYRKIAEELYRYDGFVFHGAVLNYEGRAYAVTARSGVGKTTHTRLWLEAFGDRVHYLNGDKPIIRIIDGKPIAYGTPWMGKESYGRNESAELCGIAFLERGERNVATPADLDSSVMKLISQIYMPKSADGASRTMSLADELLSLVKLVDLKCNMDIEAAYTLYGAFAEA